MFFKLCLVALVLPCILANTVPSTTTDRPVITEEHCKSTCNSIDMLFNKYDCHQNPDDWSELRTECQCTCAPQWEDNYWGCHYNVTNDNKLCRQVCRLNHFDEGQCDFFVHDDACICSAYYK